MIWEGPQVSRRISKDGTRLNTYPLTGKGVLEERRANLVIADDPKPVVGGGLLNTIVGGETGILASLLELLLEILDLLAVGGAGDGLLCRLGGLADDVGHCGVGLLENVFCGCFCCRI